MANVSRRSFVELASGLLASLPVLAGGVVLAPRPARATEGEDPTDASELAGGQSEYVIIDVVEPWQVGIMVVDVTRGEERDGGLMYYPPLAGAKVSVTSRFNGKVAEGTTDEDGVANVDIHELSVCEEGADVNNLGSYSFNGSITVELDGYRLFRTALMVVEGGTGLQVPAHPLDDTTPYPYQVAFDEWDGLYIANEFLVTPANADEHVIDTTIYNLPQEGDATIELWVVGEEQPRQSATVATGERALVGIKLEQVDRVVTEEVRVPTSDVRVPTHGSSTTTPAYTITRVVHETKRVKVYGRSVTASFKANFLKEGDAACLPVGAKLQLVVRQGSTTWTVPLAVAFLQGVVDEPAGNEGQTLSLINTQKGGTTGLGVTWPSGVPIIGGGELKFWSPQLPINVFVNPFGLVQLTLESPSWGFRNDKGNEEPHGWGKYPHKSVKDQWAKKVKVMQAMQDKTATLVSKPGPFQQIDLFKAFSIDVNFRLLALAQWDASKGIFQGEVAGQILAALNFTITENFFAGPIPVLITFALDASFVFGLAAAAYSTKKSKDEALIDAVFDFGRWHFDYENTGFTMALNVTPSLSVGVGIRGVASISVKGAITITLFLGIPMGTQPKGLPSPHLSAGWSAQVSLVLDLFLFTKSFSLFKKAFENFADNWKGKNLAAQAQQQALGALADLSLDELLDSFEPVSDAMLRATSEASISAASLVAQSSGTEGTGARTRPVDWEAARREVHGQLEDGTPMDYTIYDFSASGAQDSDEAPAADDGEKAVDVEGADALATDIAVTADAEAERIEAGIAAAADARAAGELAADITEAADEPAAGIAAAADAQAADVPAAVEPQSQVVAEADAAEAEPSGTEPAEVTASPAPQVLWLAAQSDEALPAPGIAALGLDGGVRPSSDMRLFGSDEHHIFGDPRTKVVTIGEGTGNEGELGTWSFRIAAVEVDGNMRTRVVANCIDGQPKGTMRIIEFQTNIDDMPHEDLYDYDFDVAETTDDSSAVTGIVTRSLVFAIVSGRRADTGTTLANAATDLVFTTLSFVTQDSSSQPRIEFPGTDTCVNPFSYEWFVGVTCISRKGNEILDYKTNEFHSIMSLQVLPNPHKEETNFVTFLDKCAPTADEVLKEGADVQVGIFLVSWTNHEARLNMPDQDTLKKAIGAIDDRTVHDQVFSLPRQVVRTDELGTWYTGDYDYTLMLRGNQKAHYVLVRLACDAASSSFLTRVTRCQDYDQSVRLVACDAQGYFLVSYPTDTAQLNLAPEQRDYSTWTLHAATWSDEATPQLQVEPIGPSGFNVVSFAVNPRGTFIFWPQSRDAGEDRVWTPDGVEDKTDREPVYQVMACRIRGNHFSDPFVVADLDTDTDAIVVLDTSNAAAVEMLRSVHVDTGERDSEGCVLYHASDIWYTSVPPVRCVTATACQAVEPFVAPGGSIEFHVAVRNDGNTFLSGCTLELCAETATEGTYERVPGASAQIVFQDTIQESTYNRDDGEGGLTNLEPDFALAPGKTSVYAVTVTVPTDWEAGAKHVLFLASEGVVAPDTGGVSAQADDQAALDVAAVEFHVEPGDYKVVEARTQHDQDPEQRHMATVVVAESGADGDFRPAPVTAVETGSQAPGGGGTGVGNAGSAATSRSVVPNTGDESPSGLLGAGLAAAGAAVLAYERRRAQNEHGQDGQG